MSPPADDGIGREADRATGAVARRSREAQSQAATLVTKLPSADGNLERDNASTAQVRSAVLRMLEREADRVIDETERRAVSAVSQAIGNSRLDSDALDRIEGAIDPLLREMRDVFADGADRVRRLIDDEVRAKRPVAQLQRDIEDTVAGIFARASSAADTAVMSGARKARIELAEGGDSPMGYVYAGPRDKKNRPFCRTHYDQVWTREAMRRLDNGHGLPVETSCGGYLCRHMWSPIDLEQAREQGFEIFE
jgi:hypothetical protein